MKYIPAKIICFLLLSISVQMVFSQERPVKRIVILGNRHTKPFVITRELETRVGEELDKEALNRDELHLLNLGIFSEVSMEHFAEGDSEVVFLRLEERIRFFPFPAIGYSEEEEWSFGGGVIHRNFLGRNQSVSLYGLFGGVTEYLLYFYDPWLTGDRISFRGEIYRQEWDNDFEEFHQTVTGLWGEVGKQWEYRLWLRLKAGYKLVESDRAGITLTGRRFDSVPYLLFTGIYDTRDLWSNPSRGMTLAGKAGQYGIPGEKPDFRLLYISAASFFPVRWGRTVGVMAMFAEKNGILPAYERFHLGGSSTVRGLALNTDRGSRELLTGLEYRFDIVKSRTIWRDFDLGLGGTMFLDNGAVWNSGDDIGEADFYQGFGFGLRLLVPIIEVFRVDMAWTAGANYKLEMGVGAKF